MLNYLGNTMMISNYDDTIFGIRVEICNEWMRNLYDDVNILCVIIEHHALIYDFENKNGNKVIIGVLKFNCVVKVEIVKVS